MNEEELYLFDLNGYLVVEQVLTAAEVDEANAAIDRHADGINIRLGDLSLSGESTTLDGTTGRGDLGGMLGWEKPWRDVFRHMLSHPRIVPCLNQIVGPGFRMDHSPGLITMRKGAEGCTLHGSSGPHFDPNQYYVYRDGQMHNGLTVVAWQLSDVEEGDGGLCLIPGQPQGQLRLPPADQAVAPAAGDRARDHLPRRRRRHLHRGRDPRHPALALRPRAPLAPVSLLPRQPRLRYRGTCPGRSRCWRG